MPIILRGCEQWNVNYILFCSVMVNGVFCKDITKDDNYCNYTYVRTFICAHCEDVCLQIYQLAVYRSFNALNRWISLLRVSQYTGQLGKMLAQA